MSSLRHWHLTQNWTPKLYCRSEIFPFKLRMRCVELSLLTDGQKVVWTWSSLLSKWKKSLPVQMETQGLWIFSKFQVCSGCISAASAAVVDAGVDCYDIVTGGVSAICRRDPPAASPASKTSCDVASDFLDLNTGPVVAACLVGYSESRDELTELWISGSASSTETTGSNFNAHMEPMIDQAVENAKFNRLVLVESLKGTTLAKSGHLNAT